MTFDKFTIKAQEAVLETVNIAQRNGQQNHRTGCICLAVSLKSLKYDPTTSSEVGHERTANRHALCRNQEMQHLPRVQGGGQPLPQQQTNPRY